MPPRLDPDEAVRLMRAAGAEPLEPYAGGHTPWRCRCMTCGAEVTPRLSKIRYGRGPCGACGQRAAGARRMARHAPTAFNTMRAIGLEPLDPYPGALKPWRCRCVTCGREVAPRYANAQQGLTSCAFCAGNRVEPDEAVEVMRAAGVEPLEPYPGTGVGWRCRCLTCGRDVAPDYHSIASGQGACKYCAGYGVVPEEAVEVMRAAGVEPLEPYPGSARPWRCRCLTCGKEVSPRIGGVKKGQGACKYCAANAPIDSERAASDMRAAGFQPLEPYPGSDRPWRCRCLVCSKQVSPTFSNVRSGSRCAYCKRRRVEPDEAADLMRAHDLDPLEQYPGGHTPWRCRCLRCGREVMPRYHHVRTRGTICRYCGKRGPDMTAPTLLYLLQHDGLASLKVGVSRRDSARLDQHTRQGWQVVRLWKVSTGRMAYAAEAAVLTWIRDEVGLPPYLTAINMPQGGWTETIGLDSIEVEVIAERIEAEVRSRAT